MALNRVGLGFLFTARDLASGQIRRLRSNFNQLDDDVDKAKMGENFRQLGIGLGLFTAGALTLVGSLRLAGAAGEFGQGLAGIGAVTRATTDELVLLRDTAIQAGIATQFSPDEAIEGLTSLATAGQTATQATETLIPVLDLAAGSLGQLGVAGAAEAVVGTLNSYGLAASEAGDITDRLLRITQLTNFQTRDFAAGLSTAAATGGLFNQDLNDVLITMGLLRNRNIDASRSATGLREAMTRLSADARVQNNLFEETGVRAVDSSGNVRNFVDVMLDMVDATQDMTEAERNRIVETTFGRRGMLAFASVMNATTTRVLPDGTEQILRGADAIAFLRTQMGETEGTAAAFREQLLDTFEGQRTLLRGTVQTFAVVLGEPFARVFKPIVSAVTNALNFLIRAFNQLPAPIQDVIAGVTVAAGALATLAGIAITAAAAIRLLKLANQALGFSFRGLITAMAPVLGIIGALGFIVLAFASDTEGGLQGIIDFVRGWADDLGDVFSIIGPILSGEGTVDLERWEQLSPRAQNLARIFRQVRNAVVALAEGVIEGLQPALWVVRTAFRGLAWVIGTLIELLTFATGAVAENETAQIGLQGTANSLGRVIGFLVGAFFAAKAMMIGFKIAMIAVKTVMIAFRAVQIAVTAITWLFNAALWANPIVLIVVGIMALIAAIVLLIVYFEEITDWLSRELAPTFDTMIQIWDSLAEFFTETLPNAIDTALNKVREIAIAIRDFFVGVLNDIGNFFVSIATAMPDAIVDFLPEEAQRFIEAARVTGFQFGEEMSPATREEFGRIATGRQEAFTALAPSPQETFVAAAQQEGVSDVLASQLYEFLASAGRAVPEGGFTVEIPVQIDGEEIARVVAEVNADDAARGLQE